MNMTSWKTTSAGILAIVGGITRIAFAIKAHAVTEEAVITAATAILTGLGLMFARDNNVTSEQVQAAKEKPPSGGTLPMWILVGILSFALFNTAATCPNRNGAKPTPQAVRFVTLQDTYDASLVLYDQYCERVVTGKVSKGDEADVDAAWNAYREAMKLAVAAASGNWTAPTPEALRKTAEDVATLIRSL